LAAENTRAIPAVEGTGRTHFTVFVEIALEGRGYPLETRGDKAPDLFCSTADDYFIHDFNYRDVNFVAHNGDLRANCQSKVYPEAFQAEKPTWKHHSRSA
jgi:hypothetical protein